MFSLLQIIWSVVLILGGLSLQRLGMGLQFPHQRDWVQVLATRSPILATGPVVSDQALTLWLCRRSIPTKMESSETSKVFIRRKKSTVYVDRWADPEKESHWVAPSWQFVLLLWGISSRFPLISHFGLPGSQSIFGASRNPPMCTYASLSQEGLKRLMGS